MFTLDNLPLIIVVAMLLWHSPTILQFLTFLYYKFRYSNFVVMDKNELDKNTQEIINPLKNFLASKGFVYQTMMIHDSMIIGNAQKYHIVYYYNPTNHVHAFVRTLPFRGALEAATITYETIYESKNVCTSLNGEKHHIATAPDYVYLFDHYLSSLEEVYKSHLNDRNIENEIISKEVFSSTGIVDYKTYDEHSYIEAWEKTGILKMTEYGYRFTVSWALWKFSKESIKGYRKFSKMLNSEKIEQTKDDTQSQTNGILTQLKEMDKPRGDSNKMMWFIGSMVAFVFLFGLFGFSVLDIAMIVVVLLVHELGHYMAMRYFGYTDTNIFFLPFGAATVGRKSKRNAFEEYVISLAGPLPGILIGIVILLTVMNGTSLVNSGMVNTYAIMSIVINYINLLPIYPLDGGRIMQTLLLLRYPRGQFYFYLLSLSVIIVTMLWLQDILMMIFVILLLFALKQNYYISRLLQKLLKENEPDTVDDTKVATAIVTDEKYQKESLASKANIAKQVLEILNTKKPSKWLVVFGLSTYLLFVVPPFAVIYYGYHQFSSSDYEKLSAEAKEEINIFYKKLQSYRGLTKASNENYTMQESMKILDKYLSRRDINATVGKPLLKLSDKQNMIPCTLPKQLVEIYTWHDGIEGLLVYDDLYSYKELEKNYAYEMKEFGGNKNIVPISTYTSDSGLAFSCEEKGLYMYPNYSDDNKENKRYYSFNHFLKVTAEAYKSEAYYYKKDKRIIDHQHLEKIKREYFSEEDKKRYEAMLVYLEEKAQEYVDIAYRHHKTMIIGELSRTYNIRMIKSLELYLNDEDEVVVELAQRAIEGLKSK